MKLTVSYGFYDGPLCSPECKGKCDQPKTLTWDIRPGTFKMDEYKISARSATSEGRIMQPLSSHLLSISVSD